MLKHSDHNGEVQVAQKKDIKFFNNQLLEHLNAFKDQIDQKV
jgi:hypothetical protein